MSVQSLYIVFARGSTQRRRKSVIRTSAWQSGKMECICHKISKPFRNGFQVARCPKPKKIQKMDALYCKAQGKMDDYGWLGLPPAGNLHPVQQLVDEGQVLWCSPILTSLQENPRNHKGTAQKCGFFVGSNGLPSGKHTKNYGKIHHFQLVNPRFLWPFIQ